MFTDDEKLMRIKRAFVEKIESYTTLVDMKNAINNMAATKVKNFIKHKLQEDADRIRASVQRQNNEADAVENIKTEL